MSSQRSHVVDLESHIERLDYTEVGTYEPHSEDVWS